MKNRWTSAVPAKMTAPPAAAAMLVSGTAFAADVEVLHRWTSGGEAAALNVPKQDLESQTIGWQVMPVAGCGGNAALTVLRARVTSGIWPSNTMIW